MANKNFKPLASAIPDPRKAVSSSFVPASIAIPAELVGELAALFKCLAIKGGTPADAEANFRLYADALADLPPTETTAVLRLFRIGDLGDGTWCPKPAEIRQAIIARLERQAAARRQERIEAEQIAARAAAKDRGPQSPGSRARVQAMVDQFKAGLPPDERKTAGWRAPTKAEAESWLEAHQDGAGIRPVTTISQALAEKIMPPEEIDDFARRVCR